MPKLAKMVKFPALFYYYYFQDYYLLCMLLLKFLHDVGELFGLFIGLSFCFPSQKLAFASVTLTFGG